MSTPDILLFGDQTETNFKVQELFNYAQRSTRLQSFIENALKSVHQAFADADIPDHQKYAFDSFLSLEERILAEKVPDVVLRTVLLCFAQLGHLILSVFPSPKVTSSPTNNAQAFGNRCTSTRTVEIAKVHHSGLLRWPDSRRSCCHHGIFG